MSRLVPVLGLSAAVLFFTACGKKPEPAPAVVLGGGDPKPPEPPPAPPRPPQPDEKADREVARKRLKEIGLAFHKYHDANGEFPAGLMAAPGRLVLSWRVQLLPYLGEAELFKQFKLDEPWDGPTNKPLIAKMPAVFASPTRAALDGKTHLRSFTGPMACIPFPGHPGEGPGPGWGPGPPHRPAAGRRLTDFTDGTSNTLIVAEAAAPTYWTRPDELTLRDVGGYKDDLPKLGGVFPGGFHGLMADGQVWFFPADLNETDLRAMITVNGGEVLGPDVTDRVFNAGKPPKKAVPSAIPDSFPDAAARRKAVENIRTVVKGMHDHHDTNGFLPAGVAAKGEVGLSWRVQILPYLGPEGMELHKEFRLTEPWDSANNKELIDRMPAVFASPGKPAPKGHTFLRTTVGPAGMIPVFPNQKNPATGLQPGQPVRGRIFTGILDGAVNTILVAEAAEAVPWTKPDELPLAGDYFAKGGNLTVPKIGGAFADGFHAGMADGRVTFFKAGFPDRDLFALLTPAGGEPVDPLGDADRVGYSVPWVPQPPPPK